MELPTDNIIGRYSLFASQDAVQHSLEYFCVYKIPFEITCENVIKHTRIKPMTANFMFFLSSRLIGN